MISETLRTMARARNNNFKTNGVRLRTFIINFTFSAFSIYVAVVSCIIMYPNAYLFSKSSLNCENVCRISFQLYFNIFSVIRAINLVWFRFIL